MNVYFCIGSYLLVVLILYWLITSKLPPPYDDE